MIDIVTLQKICKQLPAVTEDIKWDNDLCFSVGGKMFCVSSLDQPLRVSFKVPDDEFDERCAQEGFMPAPYMARAKWVSVNEQARVTLPEWTAFIGTSYELVKAKLTRKVQRELGLE